MLNTKQIRMAFGPVRPAAAYTEEFMETLHRIRQDHPQLSSLGYFLDTAEQWFGWASEARPEVVVLGPDLPEELILAAGAVPYWLLGGSLFSTSWSDDLVPRDTDPVSRSILGYIHRPGGPDFSESLFLIPLSCDSMRKIAYQLKQEGKKLFLVDIPPEQNRRESILQWQKQMFRMMEAVADHTNTRGTRRRLIDARLTVSRARQLLSVFLDLARGREDLLTFAARQLVRTSYYYTEDPEEWSDHLEILCQELKSHTARLYPRFRRPGILLAGSPVLFPNYKIPFLLQEIGLDIRECVDPAALKQYGTNTGRILQGGRDRMIRAIAAERYRYNASSSFVSNDAMYRYIIGSLMHGDIEGVVYHVLKGQIEYDFELERLESLFSDYGIPVFRLETDYQYQDVEQLRIRMEAFAEMLEQNRYQEVKQAQ